MRILFIGDVVGRSGREAVAASLPRLREALRIDLAVVNAENASHGFGLAPDMASALFAAGADVITLGNHAWDRKEIIPYIAEHPRLLRPLNFPPGTPGAGSVVVEVAGGRRALVAQAMGRLYMDPLDCPFRAAPNCCRDTGWAARSRRSSWISTPRRRARKWRSGTSSTARCRRWSARTRIVPRPTRRCCQVGRRSSRTPACRATTTV